MSLTVTLSEQKTSQLKAQLHVEFLAPNELVSQDLAQMYPTLQAVADAREFKGALSAAIFVPSAQAPLSYGLIVGLGKHKKNSTLPIENFRRAVGTMIRTAQQLKVSHIALTLPARELFGETKTHVLHEALIAAGLASYEFDTYFSKPRNIIQAFDLHIAECAPSEELQAVIDRAQILVKSLNEAREWVNTPPNDLFPERIAQFAQVLADEHKLKCTVLSEPEIIKLGMGGLAAVSAGSAQECKLVTLEYRCDNPDAPTIGFVGKGITFDSGGLSLKPAESMMSMKDDMSGAAAVLCAMRVIATLKPNVNVIAMTPLSENLPSGTSSKPGDIVRFYNGKTGEIKNTDAEGRLVLADALAYMVDKYKPEALIDVATLTGACVVAIGPLFTGLLSEHEEMVAQVEQAAQRGGDPVWRLPLNADYAAAVEGDISDLCNIGKSNYKAGATKGAAFLQAFVGDTPWVHLDIAGSSFDVPGISYFKPGGTGSGLRILVEFAMNYKK